MNIEAAFSKDGYDITKRETLDTGGWGVLAENRSVVNCVTGKKKTAMYVNGTAYEMGQLTSKLAPEAVYRMVIDFPDMIPGEFIDPDLPEPIAHMIGAILRHFVKEYAPRVVPTLPKTLIQEMQGVADAEKRIDFDDVLVLNVGFDILCGFAYNPDHHFELVDYLIDKYELHKEHVDIRDVQLKREHFRIPLMCNAYSAAGAATADGQSHFFGRDFQFPTGGIFQDEACMIVYAPTDGRRTLVSMAAPGMVGSIAAMNDRSVAMGVNMLPAGNTNSSQPGFNSLLLVRHSIHSGATAEEVVHVVEEAQRGVAWLYVVADGQSGRAVALETGERSLVLDALSYPPKDLLPLLPDEAFLLEFEKVKPVMGVQQRWNDFEYPEVFFKFNPDLFKKYEVPFKAEELSELGSFCTECRQEDCVPAFFFFGPQRETKADLLLATNTAINISMRLCQMYPPATLTAFQYWTDIQWRYDMLNRYLLESYGTIDGDQAWKIISFLSPTIGKYPDYYVKCLPQPVVKCQNGNDTRQVYGSTSLCDLKEIKMRSLYGYFADDSVAITLPYYVDATPVSG